MACRLEEIPEVGDWVEYKNLDKSVIVVNTKNGIKAFHNACRHRGVQLASGHGNCKTAGFICPFQSDYTKTSRCDIPSCSRTIFCCIVTCGITCCTITCCTSNSGSSSC